MGRHSCAGAVGMLRLQGCLSTASHWVEAVEDLQRLCSKAGVYGLAVEPDLGLEGAASLLEIELVAQPRALEGAIGGVAVEKPPGAVGQGGTRAGLTSRGSPGVYSKICSSTPSLGICLSTPPGWQLLIGC